MSDQSSQQTEHDPCKCCGLEMETFYKYCEPCVESNCDIHTARCGHGPGVDRQ